MTNQASTVEAAAPVFIPHAQPGHGLFVIWCSALAPEMDGVPMQYFLGEWTANGKSSDIGVYEPVTGRWRSMHVPESDKSMHLFVDPFRPKVFMSTESGLYEIDRRTLEKVKVAPLTRKYTADFDDKGRVWFMHSRRLDCYDPATGQLTTHENVLPDEFFYADGTHPGNGVAPDGRVWFTQFPKDGLSVFDPATGQTTVAWRGGNDGSWMSTPVVFDDLIWAGTRCFSVSTMQPVTAPFPVEGPDGFRLLMRGRWDRTPSQLIRRAGRPMVMRNGDRAVGYLELKTGRFEKIGHMPQLPPSHRPPDFIGGTTFLATLFTRVMKIDVATGHIEYLPLGFKPVAPQSMYHWTIGPDDLIYGSCMSHDLWRVDGSGKSEFLCDPVERYGGELHSMTNYKSRIFIAAYTNTCISRLDVSRPADKFGNNVENNPRFIHDSASAQPGQHRPRGMVTTDYGYIYLASCSDYCTRTEGALYCLNAQTEQVEFVADPLLKDEQAWAVASVCHRREICVGTSEGSFIVFDHNSRKIKKIHKFQPRPGVNDGEPTSAMIKIGGVRWMASLGDLVIGNRFGGMFDMFIYHADTGVMEEPFQHPLGRLFGLWNWHARNSLILRFNGGLYELTRDGKIGFLYDQPFPGFMMAEDSRGRLFIGDSTTIYKEADPWVDRKVQPRIVMETIR